MSWLVTGARIINSKLRGRQIPMILEYQVEASQTISLGLVEDESYELIVDWGDGSAYVEVKSWDDIDASHLYTEGGTYIVRIWGSATHWSSLNQTQSTRDSLIRVKSIGNLGWTSLDHAFYNCSNLVFIAGGRLNEVTTIESMAENCHNLQRVDSAGWYLPICENDDNAFRNCELLVNRFPEPYYRTIIIPTGDPISEMVRVRLADNEDTTLIDTIIWNEFGGETVELKPEDYLVNDGLGSNGLPAGTISVLYSLLDSDTVSFDTETLLETFEVPEYTRPIELSSVIDESDNVIFVLSPDQNNLTQSYQIEISDSEYTPILTIDRPLYRLNPHWPWPIDPKSRGSLPLMLPSGTYNYRIAALNREYNDVSVEWGAYQNFNISVTPTFNSTVAVTLSDNLPNEVVLHPNATTGKCKVTLYWDIKADISEYRMSLTKDGAVAIISNEIVEGNSKVVELDPTALQYTWAIRGRKNGTNSPWSVIKTIHVQPTLDPLLMLVRSTDTPPVFTFLTKGVYPTYVDIQIKDSSTGIDTDITDLDPLGSWTPSGVLNYNDRVYWIRGVSRLGLGGTVYGEWTLWDVYTGSDAPP